MSSEWIDIVDYREFHDVPRVFVVRHKGRELLFDCAFDKALDDYSRHYAVYALSSAGEAARRKESWSSLSEHGQPLGSVATEEVVFDATRRRAVSAAVVARIGG